MEERTISCVQSKPGKRL